MGSACEAQDSYIRPLVILAVLAILAAMLLTGCITMNNCHYCHEDRHPDYTKHVYTDMGDGVQREIKWYGWVHYEKRIPQPDKVIELKEDK